MHLNLGSILQGSTDARPDHVAIRHDERTLTYAELDRAARGVAASLRTRGIEPGMAVAILVPNLPEFTITYFGILYAGCTVVPLNVLLSGPEVQYHLEDSGARLLVAHPLFEEPAKTGAAAAGVDLVWAAGDGEGTVAGMAAADPVDALHTTEPADTAVILYTSGTTGKPKGAELTHSEPASSTRPVVVPKLIDLPAPTTWRSATLPLFHSFGQTCIQNATLGLGGTFTLLPRFGPDEAFAGDRARRRDALRRGSHHVLRAAPPRGREAEPTSRSSASACRAARPCPSR